MTMLRLMSPNSSRVLSKISIPKPPKMLTWNLRVQLISLWVKDMAILLLQQNQLKILLHPLPKQASMTLLKPRTRVKMERVRTTFSLILKNLALSQDPRRMSQLKFKPRPKTQTRFRKKVRHQERQQLLRPLLPQKLSLQAQ